MIGRHGPFGQMLAQHCRLYQVNALTRSTGLAFLTHLPHGTFRSHLCLSLRRTVSAASVMIRCDIVACLRHSAHALRVTPGFVAMVVIRVSNIGRDWNAIFG
jgi:hypothetical protein